jgi:hypothetical protein
MDVFGEVRDVVVVVKGTFVFVIADVESCTGLAYIDFVVIWAG